MFLYLAVWIAFGVLLAFVRLFRRQSAPAGCNYGCASCAYLAGVVGACNRCRSLVIWCCPMPPGSEDAARAYDGHGG